MKTLSKMQLIQLFLNPQVSGINGNTFIGIDTLTDVKLSGGKANVMQGKVKKCCVGSNVMVFQNKTTNGYANMVEKRLIAEGKNPESFELQPRSWGTRIENTPLVFHEEKEQYYLEVIFIKAGEVSYLLDGKPIKKELVEGLPESKEYDGQGGLDNKVIIRSYKIDSISRITIAKETYLIVE